MSINGEPGRPPVRVGPSIVDQGTGIWTALGVLAALRHRDTTGEAQLVETSLFEVGVSWMSYSASNHLATGEIPGPNDARHPSMAPYEGFMTSDNYLFVANLNGRLFQQLCGALGRPEWGRDPRYLTNADRVAHRDELGAAIGEIMLGRTAEEWESILRERGVPCSQVKTVDQVLEDDQVKALAMVKPWKNDRIPGFRLIDHPVSYNGTRSFREDPPPELGEHTAKLTAEFGLESLPDAESDGE